MDFGISFVHHVGAEIDQAIDDPVHGVFVAGNQTRAVA